MPHTVNMYNIYKYAPRMKIEGRGGVYKYAPKMKIEGRGGNCIYETNRSQFNRKHNPNSIKLQPMAFGVNDTSIPISMGWRVKMGFESPQVRKYIT